MTRVTVAAALLIVVWAESARCEQGATRPWQVALTANLDRWSSDSDHEGDQSQLFAQMAYEGERWGLSATGRYLSTRYRTSLADESFTLSDPTDTAVASRYDWRTGDWIIRAGLDFDIPTGHASFSAAERERTILDPVAGDLMNVTFFGGGFNAAPHLIATYRFGDRLAAAFGGRYLFAGAYDPTTDVPDDDYDPGDRALVSITVVHTPDTNNTVTGSLVRINAAEDRSGGEAVFKAGAITRFDLRWDRTWADGWQAGLAFAGHRQETSAVIAGDGAAPRERLDANNNLLSLIGTLAAPLANRWSLTAMVGYKQAASNQVAETDPFYDAGRSLGFFEAGAIYSASVRWYTTAKLRYTRIADKKDAFAKEDMTYQVINLDLAFVYRY